MFFELGWVKFDVFLELVSRLLFASIFNGIIDSWSSENKVFARKVLQKPCFRKNRLLVIRGSILSVFWKPWEQVF